MEDRKWQQRSAKSVEQIDGILVGMILVDLPSWILICGLFSWTVIHDEMVF